MIRVLCAISVLAFTACTAPPRYIYEPLGPVQLAIAPSDTSAVRQLCAEPERVVAGETPCLLRGTEGTVSSRAVAGRSTRVVAASTGS